MSKAYTVSGSTSVTEHFSPVMSAGYTEATVPSVLFYDDEDNIVLPSAGLVVFEMSYDKNTFMSVDNGTFLAAQAYSGDRQMPNAKGTAVYAKVTLSGIQGASRFALTIHRS